MAKHAERPVTVEIAVSLICKSFMSGTAVVVQQPHMISLPATIGQCKAKAHHGAAGMLSRNSRFSVDFEMDIPFRLSQGIKLSYGVS